jgi:hypothetical protein
MQLSGRNFVEGPIGKDVKLLVADSIPSRTLYCSDLRGQRSEGKGCLQIGQSRELEWKYPSSGWIAYRN